LQLLQPYVNITVASCYSRYLQGNMMKPLAGLRVTRRAPPAPNLAQVYLERQADNERWESRKWKQRYIAPAVESIVDLVNLSDTSEAIADFRRRLPEHYDIASSLAAGFRDNDQENSRREANRQLIELRDQLREFWGEATCVGLTPPNETRIAEIIESWRTWYPFNEQGYSEGWWVFWSAGTVYPMQHNFRGAIIRVLFDKRLYLANCPTCGRHFIGDRLNQKYCLSESCLRQANRKRQKNFQARHAKEQPVRKSKRGTS
jgi:hypothetical protein